MYGNTPKKSAIHYTLPDGTKHKNKKVLKSTVETHYDALLKKLGTNELLADDIINNETEINWQQTGKIQEEKIH